MSKKKVRRSGARLTLWLLPGLLRAIKRAGVDTNRSARDIIEEALLAYYQIDNETAAALKSVHSQKVGPVSRKIARKVQKKVDTKT